MGPLIPPLQSREGGGEFAPDRGKMRTREAIAKLAADFWKRTNKNLGSLKVFNGRVLSVHQHDLTRDASAADTQVGGRVPAGICTRQRVGADVPDSAMHNLNTPSLGGF